MFAGLKNRTKKAFAVFSVATVASILAIGWQGEPATTASYIVQGKSVAELRSLVAEFDAEITHELGVIRAIAAELTDDQVAALRRHESVLRVYGNDPVT